MVRNSCMFNRVKPLPEGDQDNILDWFYEQIDNLNSVMSLGLSVEEIGTSLILQQFPEEYAKEVRQGLRVSDAAKAKAAFTIKELRAVVNDTIAVKHDPDKTALKSTLHFQTPTSKVETEVTSNGQTVPQSNPQQQNQQRKRRGRGWH